MSFVENKQLESANQGKLCRSCTLEYVKSALSCYRLYGTTCANISLERVSYLLWCKCVIRLPHICSSLRVENEEMLFCLGSWSVICPACSCKLVLQMWWWVPCKRSSNSSNVKRFCSQSRMYMTNRLYRKHYIIMPPPIQAYPAWVSLSVSSFFIQTARRYRTGALYFTMVVHARHVLAPPWHVHIGIFGLWSELNKPWDHCFGGMARKCGKPLISISVLVGR